MNACMRDALRKIEGKSDCINGVETVSANQKQKLAHNTLLPTSTPLELPVSRSLLDE